MIIFPYAVEVILYIGLENQPYTDIETISSARGEILNFCTENFKKKFYFSFYNLYVEDQADLTLFILFYDKAIWRHRAAYEIDNDPVFYV